MFSGEKKLFIPVESSLLFTARACFWGRFSPNQRRDKPRSVSGVLTTSDGRDFPAIIKKKTWEYLLTREDFNPNQESYWRSYLLTNKSGVVSRIEIIRPILNLVFPILLDERGELVEEALDLGKIRGQIQTIDKSQFVVRIERNEPLVKRRPGSQRFNAFYLTIQGELPDVAALEQFWEIICIREGDYLKLKEAILITEEMISSAKETSKKSPSKSKKKSPNQSSKLEETTVIESEIIMVNGKQPEITVKFTERPQLPEQGKKVTLQVTGENGIVVKALLNRKTLAKQVQKMDSFSDWVAALSGKISEITTEGMVILEAGNVQVFEKKQKVKSEEKETKTSELVA